MDDKKDKFMARLNRIKSIRIPVQNKPGGKRDRGKDKR
jgi:hypothetical protein